MTGGTVSDRGHMITDKDEEVGFEEVTRGKAILGGYSDKALLIEEGERGGFRMKG